jgi:hypothetical protein
MNRPVDSDRRDALNDNTRRVADDVKRATPSNIALFPRYTGMENGYLLENFLA